jgi:hypothetical protein
MQDPARVARRTRRSTAFAKPSVVAERQLPRGLVVEPVLERRLALDSLRACLAPLGAAGSHACRMTYGVFPTTEWVHLAPCATAAIATTSGHGVAVALGF